MFTSDRGGSADIYRVHADGSGLERLVDDPAYDDQAALSPDGDLLAFVSSRSGQADIWILVLATGELRNLTSHPAGDFRPAWSPDGRWIAFSSDRNSRKPIGLTGFSLWHSTEIYIVQPDGSGLRRMTQAQEFAGSPTWSTDGQRLIYYQAEIAEVGNIVSVLPKRGTTQIATIDLATNEHQVLTTGSGEKRSPRFLAGDGIAYTSGSPR